MNIPVFQNLSFKGNNNSLKSIVKDSNYCVNSTSYPNLRPLAKDTVSFSGWKVNTNKAVKASKKKVSDFWNPEATNFEEIIKLCGNFEKPFEKFMWDLKQAMRPFVSTESNPSNAIIAGKKGIHGRVKSPYSTAIKANDRELFEIDEIERMGDVGGARIVLRTGDQADTAKVFTGLRELVKKGYKILEIENYRFSVKESYVSQKTLNVFEAFCKKYNQYPAITSRPIENSYNAVHLSIELPDGKVIELQILGRDVEHVKDVEDFFYKYRCNKKFDEKYAPIQEIFDRLMPKLDDFQKTTLARYIKDSYEHAKQIQPKTNKQKWSLYKDFLPFPYSLPKELSFENLHRMKLKCDTEAAKAKKAAKTRS